MRAALAKRLLFLLQPMIILNLGVVFADIVVDAKAPHSVTYSNMSPVNAT